MAQLVAHLDDPEAGPLESPRFRYKVPVALYLSYLHIKSDDEIKRNPIEFQHNLQLACVQS